MGRCVVPGCVNDTSSTRNKRGYSLHAPPRNKKLGPGAMKVKWWKWLRNCRKDLKQPPTDRSFVICSEHFALEDIKNYRQRLSLMDSGYSGRIPG